MGTKQITGMFIEDLNFIDSASFSFLFLSLSSWVGSPDSPPPPPPQMFWLAAHLRGQLNKSYNTQMNKGTKVTTEQQRRNKALWRYNQKCPNNK